MDSLKHQNLYAYLEASGVLDTGDDSVIKDAKRAYWKEYRRIYKQAYRKRHKQVAIHLSHELYDTIVHRVKALDVALPVYVKRLIEIDAGKEVSIGVPDSVVLAQTISRIYSEIQNLIRNHVHGSTVPPYLYDELLARVEYLESIVSKRRA